MRLRKIIRRFLIPNSIITAIYYIKFRCKVSPRAEVELSPLLKIGKKTEISSFCKIKAADGDLRIGSNVSVGSCCFISSDKGGVYIGDHCMIGTNVSIIGNKYKFDRLDIPVCMQEKTSEGIRIGNNVWVGAGSVIIDGADIGNNVIIAPNSVVSKKVPDNAMLKGDPAKVVFVRR